MKKMFILLTGLSFVLSIFLLYYTIMAHTQGAPILGSRYIINSKFFGEPADLRFWITPNEYAIQKEAQNLRDKDPLTTITKTYNWLENGYHYEEDDLIVLNNGKIVLRGGVDSWNLPIFTLAEKHQNSNECWVDCEDGTFLLVSLLRANGIEAWANIGTVSLEGSIYGHAWATVVLDGKEYLLETTLGEPLKELRPVPDIYKVSVKFNEQQILAITGADINKEIYPPLPPAKIPQLKNALNN
ncbi:MAG: hypothetical protein ACPLYF_03100 [Fervidobacterium sp.]